MGTNHYEKRNKYSDQELVECYLACEHSQNKASEKLGVSRETVARAVRRSGIQLDGCKYRTTIGKNGIVELNRKITDEQLASLIQDHSCISISHMFNMSAHQVYVRALKLGFHPTFGKGAKSRIDGYGFGAEYDETIKLNDVYVKYKGICALCGKPTDYKDCIGGRPRKHYPSIDHIIPLSKGGSHTWENVQLAHIGCNSKKWNKEA